MKRIVIPVKIGLAAGVASVLFGPMLTVGRIPFGDIALLGAYFVVVPSVILSLILLALPRLNLCLLPGIGFGVAIFFLVLLIGAGPADALKRRHCREAKVFCESLIPRLEEYRSHHGGYPKQVTEVLRPDDALPMYLRRQNFYHQTNDTYSLSWVDSPGVPYCSGVAAYHHSATNWDFCADWGGTQ